MGGMWCARKSESLAPSQADGRKKFGRGYCTGGGWCLRLDGWFDTGRFAIDLMHYGGLWWSEAGDTVSSSPCPVFLLKWLDCRWQAVPCACFPCRAFFCFCWRPLWRCLAVTFPGWNTAGGGYGLVVALIMSDVIRVWRKFHHSSQTGLYCTFFFFFLCVFLCCSLFSVLCLLPIIASFRRSRPPIGLLLFHVCMICVPCLSVYAKGDWRMVKSSNAPSCGIGAWLGRWGGRRGYVLQGRKANLVRAYLPLPSLWIYFWVRISSCCFVR